MPNQIDFFTFDRHIQAEQVFEKIHKLLDSQGVKSAVTFKYNSGWKLTIDGVETQLEDLKFGYNWVVNEYELLNVPLFYSQLIDALQPLLSSGSFYYGIMKDEDNRKHQDFVFIVLFVQNGHQDILKQFRKFEWKKLGPSTTDAGAIDSGKVRSIRYKVYPDKTVFNWKSRSNTMTGFLFLVVVMIVFGLVDKIFKWGEHDIPYAVFIYGACGIVPLWILDYFNRLILLVADQEKIVLRKGQLPFFPGYRRRTFYYKELIKIWTKLKHNSSAGSEMTMPDGTDYIVYVTTSKPKEIRLSNKLDQSEATLLEGKLKEQWEKSKKAN